MAQIFTSCEDKSNGVEWRKLSYKGGLDAGKCSVMSNAIANMKRYDDGCKAEFVRPKLKSVYQTVASV